MPPSPKSGKRSPKAGSPKGRGSPGRGGNDEDDDASDSGSDGSGSAGFGSPRSFGDADDANWGSKSMKGAGLKAKLMHQIRRCLRYTFNRKRLGIPRCKMCVYIAPCLYCFHPETLLVREVLIKEMQAASGSKTVNKDLVDATIQHDKERRLQNKKKWQRRWRACGCILVVATCVGLILSVIFFAIGSWSQLCEECGWSGRANFGAAMTADGRIFIAGGTDGSQNFGDVWSGDRTGESWTRLTDLAPFGPRHGHSLLCYRNSGELFLFGGDSGGVGDLSSLPLRDVWSSKDGKNWVMQTKSAPWVARKFFAALVDAEGRLYIAGGLSGHGTGGLNDMWRSEDGGRTWEALSLGASWNARHSFPIVSLPEGSMYILGGTDGMALHDVWVSSDYGKSWTKVRFTHRRESSFDKFEYRAPWLPRASAAAITDSNGITKIIGGQTDEEGPEGYFSREVWELPPPEGPPSEWWLKKSNSDLLNSRQKPLEWSLNSEPPWTARSGHQALVDPDGDAVYILGGKDRKGFKADMWNDKMSLDLYNLVSRAELIMLQVTR
eukprot:TRINITY_DN48124_c0_g1_i1.p1 TRINITY_DN48124_c0_g1~~TRINITY_DN48124_c0_g1_i1.p1  ORF type:complete len:551 (+),score=88.61 TRINITY_DN48124_c0_g1_i1:48-1700(+)